MLQGQARTSELELSVAGWQAAFAQVKRVLSSMPAPWDDEKAAEAHEKVNKAHDAFSEELCLMLLPPPEDSDVEGD